MSSYYDLFELIVSRCQTMERFLWLQSVSWMFIWSMWMRIDTLPHSRIPYSKPVYTVSQFVVGTNIDNRLHNSVINSIFAFILEKNIRENPMINSYLFMVWTFNFRERSDWNSGDQFGSDGCWWKWKFHSRNRWRRWKSCVYCSRRYGGISRNDLLVWDGSAPFCPRVISEVKREE